MIGDYTGEGREATAYHEAGHTIAALVRGGGSVKSVTIEPTARHSGLTWVNVKSCDSAFVTFGGMWAEAEYCWRTDDAGEFTFNDYLVGVLVMQPLDRSDYERAMQERPGIVDRTATENSWGEELRQYWTQIEQVAVLLLRLTTVYDVRIYDDGSINYATACGGGR